MTVANWWRFKHGVDPVPNLRGSYSTEDECRAVVEREGGMLAAITACAARVNAIECGDPQPGDIGVIAVHGLEFGAIMGPSGRWMVKSRHGIAGYRCQHIKAWRI
ncbi:hypothetical protein J3A73_004353 [Rhizobium sp. PvP099]|nr:hypothetical protein [Rhizobium sp. PvP099]